MRARDVGRYLPWLLALGAAVLVAFSVRHAVRALADDSSQRDLILGNSDFLFPPAVYQDVMVDGYGVRSIQWSAATFAFPDVATYFAVRPFFDRAGQALVPWLGLLFAVLVLSAWGAGRQAVPPPARAWLPAAMLGWVAVYLADQSRGLFQSQSAELLFPDSHNGALAGVFLGFALAVGFLGAATTRGRAAWLIGLTVLCAVMTFSDRWFGVWFAAPLGFTLAAARVLLPSRSGGVTVRAAAALLAATAVGCGLGLVAIKQLLGGGEDPVKNYWGDGLRWAGLGSRAAWLAGAAWGQVREGNLLVAAGAAWYPVAAVVVARAALRRAAAHPPFVLYCLLAGCLTACGLALVLLTDLSHAAQQDGVPWRGYSRYLLGPLGVGFFGWPVTLAYAAAEFPVRAVRAAAGAGPVLAAGVAVAVAGSAPRSWDHDPLDYYPWYVQFVDEVSALHGGLPHGLGGYWESKAVTLLSRGGVRVRAVRWDAGRVGGFMARPWLSSARSYTECPHGVTEGLRYEFIICLEGEVPLPGPSEAQVVGAYGPPAANYSHAGFAILVYDRPTDDRFQRVHETEPSFLELPLLYGYGRSVRYPGRGFRGPPGIDPSAPVRAWAGPDPATIAYGPFLRNPPPGRYRATFRVTSCGPSPPRGAVDVYVNAAPQNDKIIAGAKEIPPGFDGEIAIDFRVPRRHADWHFEFRTHSLGGNGRLELHWVELEKTR